MDPKHLPNRDLINHLAYAGPDDPLWQEFLSRFRPRLRLVVLRSYRTEAERTPGLDASDAMHVVDDLTQEVLVKLLESDRRALARFQGRTEHSAYTYMSAIAVNHVRDHFKTLRALKKPPALSELTSMAEEEATSPGASHAYAVMSHRSGPERFVASSELRSEIRAAVDGLSPTGSTSARDRLVFHLYFIEGLTVDEIASNRSVRLTASGVEKRIRRIRDALRERLFSASEGGRGA